MTSSGWLERTDHGRAGDISLKGACVAGDTETWPEILTLRFMTAKTAFT